MNSTWLKIRILLILVLTSAILSPTITAEANDTDVANIEYQIKVAFLYNFLKFVEFSEEKSVDPNEPVIISIIGEDVFNDTINYLENKTIKGRKIIVNKYKGIEELQNNDQTKTSKLHPETDAIRKTHLLFICPSEKKHVKEILKLIKGYGVLTVADNKGFLEAGGIINFLTENERVRFEVNLVAAKQAEINIRSKLLRLAKRIYKPKDK